MSRQLLKIETWQKQCTSISGGYEFLKDHTTPTSVRGKHMLTPYRRQGPLITRQRVPDLSDRQL